MSCIKDCFVNTPRPLLFPLPPLSCVCLCVCIYIFLVLHSYGVPEPDDKRLNVQLSPTFRAHDE